MLKNLCDLKKSLFVFLLFVGLVNSNKSFSQVGLQNSTTNLYKIISFGETLNLDGVEDSIEWRISKTDSDYFSTTLHGNEINKMVFEKSGNYSILCTDNHPKLDLECNHSRFPEKMDIVVTPFKMSFDFSHINFSQPLEVGQECSSIIVSIPVEISILKGCPKTINVPDFRVSGIGCEITAKPINSTIILKNGIQILNYSLMGVASKPSYLMFDFTDFNNHIIPYNYNELVK